MRSYSQGMRQRVAIAQAMLGLPDLLVLDEPTNGLDPPQIHAMREVLRSYAATGRTVIVSSHLLSEIEQTCSHVVVMAKGQKIAQGTVEEIVGAGGAVLVGLADDADAARAIAVLEELPGVTAELTDEGLVADLDGTSRARALQALVEAGVAVDQFTPRRRLEDAFLALVGRTHERHQRRARAADRGRRGYRPGRTLRLTVELRRQFKRRRTIGVLALMVALPLVLIAALNLGASDNAQQNSRINLVDVATASGLNFTLFVLFGTTGFSWSSCSRCSSATRWRARPSGGRWLHAGPPVPRMRLLRQKWFAALVLSFGAFLLLVVVGLVAGGSRSGSTRSPRRSASPSDRAGLLRLAGMVGYLTVHLLVVGTLAFWLSTVTDAPLAAVGGAIFTMFVFAILDQVEQLGAIRDWFPTAGEFAWTDLLQTPSTPPTCSAA